MLSPIPLQSTEIKRLRLLALAWAAAMLVVALFFSGTLERTLGRAFFDRVQALFPRVASTQPVKIVAIDERALAEQGQWPWPRAKTAALVAAVNAQQPFAVGLDILFAEADRYSGPPLLSALPGLRADAAREVLAQPSGDALLAQAIVAGNVVLGRAGIDSGADSPLLPEAVPVGSTIAGPRPALLAQYGGLLPSVAEISAAASGHGLSSVRFDGGVVRSMPLLSRVGPSAMMPALGLAMLQQAAKNPTIGLESDPAGALRRVTLDGWSIPVNRDGSFNLHFSPRDARRLISAADLLAGRIPADALKDRLVLVGFTALALMDVVATPIGERMPGVEVHAQLIETLLNQHWLQRPSWARSVEWLTLAISSTLLVWFVPVLRPVRSVALWLLLSAGLLASGVIAFHAHWLIDVASVFALLTAVFGGALALTLQMAVVQRQRLSEDLQHERESAARLEGEMAAACRVQMGMLPSAADWPKDRRLELAAIMVPARRVGGDLYDLILLDEHTLCFLIGDVAGKGLPASVFMALTKALMKSLALRGESSAAALLSAANREVARDNPEALFVTALVAYLDLRTGKLDLASAGHEAPSMLSGRGESPKVLDLVGGPPLCVIDGYAYAGVSWQLEPGDALVLSTDGIQEAQNRTGDLYGRERFAESLANCPGGLAATEILSNVQADVARFVDGAEAADDASLLVLRWRGSTAALVASNGVDVTGSQGDKP